MLAIAPTSEEKVHKKRTPSVAEILDVPKENNAWMKQTADEVRAVKDKLRAARNADTANIMQASNGQSKPIRDKEGVNISREYEQKLGMENCLSGLSNYGEPSHGKGSPKHKEVGSTRPRWSIPARDLRDSERCTYKEMKFLKVREKQRGQALVDEIDRKQESKLCNLKRLQLAWWEREDPLKNGKVRYRSKYCINCCRCLKIVVSTWPGLRKST
jgi:hypothetical protein